MSISSQNSCGIVHGNPYTLRLEEFFEKDSDFKDLAAVLKIQAIKVSDVVKNVTTVEQYRQLSNDLINLSGYFRIMGEKGFSPYNIRKDQLVEMIEDIRRRALDSCKQMQERTHLECRPFFEMGSRKTETVSNKYPNLYLQVEAADEFKRA